MGLFENLIFRTGGDPASRARMIEPSDTNDLPFPCRAFSVNTEGMVRLTTTGGDDIEVMVYSGSPFPVRTRRVHATGTTATGICIYE